MNTNIMLRWALFTCCLTLATATQASKTIPDSARLNENKESYAEWFYTRSFGSNNFLMQTAFAKSLPYLLSAVTPMFGPVISDSITSKSLQIPYTKILAAFTSGNIVYFWNQICESAKDPASIYLNLVVGTQIIGKLYTKGSNLYDYVVSPDSSVTDYYAIDDHKNTISKVANVVLATPPGSKRGGRSFSDSLYENVINPLYEEFFPETERERTSSSKEKTVDLSSKVAYWDITKPKVVSEEDTSWWKGPLQWVASFGGNSEPDNSFGKGNQLLEKLAKITSLLPQACTLRIFMSKHLAETGLNLKIVIIRLDENNRILDSSPLIDIPTKLEINARSFSDLIACNEDQHQHQDEDEDEDITEGEQLYTPLSFLGAFIEALESDNNPPDENMSLFERYTNIRPQLEDIEVRPMLNLSEPTLSAFGTPENLWFFNNFYSSSGEHDISVRFGEDEFNISDDDYSNSESSKLTKLKRKVELLNVLKNKALNDLGKI